MYRITLGDKLIFDASYVGGPQAISPVLTQGLNVPGELKLSLPVTHDSYNQIQKLQSELTVYRNKKLIWQGRVIEDSQDIYKNKEIYCEGVLAYLYDSIIRPFEEVEATPTTLLQKLLSEHNSQVHMQQQFQLGEITVIDEESLLVSHIDKHTSTWEVIKKNLLEPLGGYIQVRFQEGVRYLDYLVDFPDTSTQKVSYGENILDIFLESSAVNTYTACIPLGAKQSDDERLTISSVNQGKDYLVNQGQADRLGVIYAPVSETTWDDITDVLTLKIKAQDYLTSQANRFAQSIEIKAVDLSNLDATIESFAFGDYVLVESEKHDVSQRYLINKLEIPLDDPAKMVFTLGNTMLTLTDQQLKSESSTIKHIESVESNYVTNEAMAAVVSEQLQNNSLIVQTAQEIMLKALEEYTSKTELEEIKQILETKMEVEASGITMSFKEVIEELQKTDGEISSEIKAMESYIRFEGGAIVLGMEDSTAIKLRIVNDRIYFFQGADNTEQIDQALAYFTSNQLFVRNAEIISELKLGKFAFLPRENGNLSFRKVHE